MKEIAGTVATLGGNIACNDPLRLFGPALSLQTVEFSGQGFVKAIQ